MLFASIPWTPLAWEEIPNLLNENLKTYNVDEGKAGVRLQYAPDGYWDCRIDFDDAISNTQKLGAFAAFMTILEAFDQAEQPLRFRWQGSVGDPLISRLVQEGRQAGYTIRAHALPTNVEGNPLPEGTPVIYKAFIREFSY